MKKIEAAMRAFGGHVGVYGAMRAALKAVGIDPDEELPGEPGASTSDSSSTVKLVIGDHYYWRWKCAVGVSRIEGRISMVDIGANGRTRLRLNGVGDEVRYSALVDLDHIELTRVVVEP